MSSFKRRAGPSATALPRGCIPSPSSSSLPLLSSGIPSLDDVLGGGIPLGTTCAVLAPDGHSAWGRLVERYLIAQGLAAGQDVVLVGGEGAGLRELVRGCMWVDEGVVLASHGEGQGGAGEQDSDAEGLEADDGNRTRIAWRYDKMKRFQTSVAGRPTGAAANFSHALNLTQSIPLSVVEAAEASGQITYLAVDELGDDAGPSSPFAPMCSLLQRLEGVLQERGGLHKEAGGERKAVRVVLHDMGELSWGDGLQEKHVLRFLHALRCLVSRSTACAVLTLPPTLCAAPPHAGGHSPTSPHTSTTTAWQTLLARAVDTCLVLTGFSSSPALALSFPHSHGLLDPLALPQPGALLPPAFRHSALLGLAAGGGAGQNNLAFRAKRKRWVVETLHLGVEGGVGERRTEPPKGAAGAGVVVGQHVHDHGHEHHRHAAAQGVEPASTRSAVRIGFEDDEPVPARPSRVRIGGDEEAPARPTSLGLGKTGQPLKSAWKKVAFQHDKPELCEF